MRFSERPLRPSTLLACAAALALAGWMLFIIVDGRESSHLLGGLLVSSALAGAWRVELSVFRSRVPWLFTLVCLALVLKGIPAAAGCAALGTLLNATVERQEGSWRVRVLRPPFARVLLTLVTAGLATVLSGFLYEWILAEVPGSAVGPIAAISGFAAAYSFIHATGVALGKGRAFFTVWRETFARTAPGFVTLGFAAVGIDRVWVGMGPFALVALLPIWVIYRSSRADLDRERQRTRQMEELGRLNQAVVASLATAIDAKDRYTAAHINRVQHYALSLAREVGLSGGELQAVTTGAVVHDIGKLGIPDHILGKPGKLTVDEFKRIQSHVTIGAEILSPIPFSFPVVDVVLTHHERWDGLGYPRGLQGEEIPMGGRILALADVFDSLTSDRPYRRAMSNEEALAELRANAGRQFDPRLVETFERIQPQCAREILEMEAAARRADAKRAAASADGTAFSRISQAAAEMAAVSDLTHSLAEHETQEQIARTVVSRALSLLPADTAVLYLRRPDEMVLEAIGVEGKYRAKLENMTIQMGEGVAGWVAANLKPRVNVSASLDIARRFSPGEAIELNAATAVPLVQGPETLGVLAVYTNSYSMLSEHHQRLLTIVAEHAAAALQNTRRVEHHRELAHTDPLTGLVNSRGLVRHLDRLLLSHNRAEGPRGEFSLIMLDVDRFKEVNDTLGHLRGDDLLREIGSIIASLSRGNDIPCRYAGDEFVLLLPATGRDQAEEVAVRVRNTVDRIPAVDGRVKIGASVGVATFPGDGMTSRELVQSADRRMYEDKALRRSSRPAVKVVDERVPA